jgi:hypothetical protein
MLVEHAVEGWTPSTESERAAIRQQLEKLLLDPHFSSSKRYPTFLRFVLERTLSGEADLLKERTLGIEVFGRPADYDTATDPIVRVTAAEIRKRIEQYYHEPGHENELRLALRAGSYALQFYAAVQETPVSTGEVRPALDTPHEVPEASKARVYKRRIWIAGIIVAISVIGTVGGLLLRAFQPSAAQRFWAPYVKSNEPILFCIADQSQYSTITLRDANDPLRTTTLKDNLITVVIDDVSPLTGIAGVLQSAGHSYRVQGQSSTSLTDLRRGPSVLIGAYDNGWTLRLTSPLRFHFANDPDMRKFWIEDRNKPGDRQWVLDRSQQMQTETYKDYAIVARFVDPNTDRFVLVAAGIARGGTVAAGEFLVDPRYIDELSRRLPSDWSRRNIEVVLETQVIDSRSGPPRIAAVSVW